MLYNTKTYAAYNKIDKKCDHQIIAAKCENSVFCKYVFKTVFNGAFLVQKTICNGFPR